MKELVAIFALSLLSAACSSDKVIPATQLLVTVESELSVPSQLARIEAEVSDAAGKVVDKHSFKLTKAMPGKNEVRLPFSFGIVKNKAARLQLLVTGYGPDAGGDEHAVVEQKVSVSFQAQKTVRLTVTLGTVCFEKVCDADMTCYLETQDGTRAGACGPVPDAMVTTSGGPDASMPAAGTRGELDAGTPRAGSGGKAPAAGSGGAGKPAGTAGMSAGTAAVCTPNCAGKKCGSDGCMGTCGNCANTEKCEAGSCVCVPNCTGKKCGSDGCGGQCGMCAGNETCDTGGKCICIPNCADAECGPDGCGGQCSPGCDATTGTCVSGVCKGVCGAIWEGCNCEVPPSQVVGSQRAEPACASGFAVLQTCSGSCVDPNTGAATGTPWGELCGCN